MTVNLGDTNNNHPTGSTFQATPQIEFHTGQALTNRLWRCIIHRWMSLYILEHLFRPQGASYWNHQDALIYSFQMFANAGRSRYDFLAPMAGLCLQFIDPKHDIESNRDHLNTIWKDPEKLVPFGNTFLTTITEKEKISIITSTFLDLARACPQKCSYDPRHQPLEKRWLMLRAFVFHYWLDQAKNQNIRTQVTNSINSSPHPPDKRLQQSSRQPKKGPRDSISITNTTTDPVANAPKTACFDIEISPATNTWTDNFDNSPNGLESLMSTRTLLERNEVPQVEIPQPTKQPTKHPGQILNFEDVSLVHPQTMRDSVSSYLLVHTEDGIDIVSKLSPLEVYSADNLYLRRHGRFSGDKLFYPSNNVGDIDSCYLVKATTYKFLV